MNNFEENYYSHWLDNNDLLNQRDIKLIGKEDLNNLNTVGLPIGSLNDKLIVDTSIDSTIVIGSTGSGKTQLVLFPMMYQSIAAGESLVVISSNSEVSETTIESFKENGYNVVNIDLNNLKYSDGWNLFELPKKLYESGDKDTSYTLVSKITSNIVNTCNSAQDPFWENTASSYLTGIVMGLFEKNIDLSKINFKTIAKICNFSSNENVIDFLNSLDKSGIAYQNIASTHLAPPETKASILSVLNERITYLNSKELLVSMLSNSSFDITKLRDEKTVLYINCDTTDLKLSSIFNIFIEQIMFVLNNDSKSKPVNILFEKFDENAKPIYNFVGRIDNLRNSKVRLVLFVNGFDKLNSVYGNSNVDELKFKCSKILYLISNEYNTLNFISEYCGKKSSTEYLVSPEALKRMPMWTSLLIKSRLMPYCSKLVPFYTTGLEFKGGILEEKNRNKVEELDFENM